MPEIKSVEIHRSPTKGFGFSIIGGSNTHLPPMICALVSEGPAASSGKVGIGDIVEKVNGINARELPTRSIVEIVRRSKDKVILVLSEDPETKASARRFLTFNTTQQPQTESHDLCTASPGRSLGNKTFASGSSSKVFAQTPSDSAGKVVSKSASPCYNRTVGSPDYEIFGADGRFTKAGSLARTPAHFEFEGKESSVRLEPEVPESDPKQLSLQPANLSTGKEESSPHAIALQTSSGEESSRSRHESSNGTSIVKLADVNRFFSLDDLYIAGDIKQENRLSKPLFGSAPRISSQSRDRNMKQNQGPRNVPNVIVRPSLHRRSASHDEQTWSHLQRQTDFRRPVYNTDANFSSVPRGMRTGPTVRFEDATNQKRANQSWSSCQPKDRRGGAPLANGNTPNAPYGSSKPTNNAQDLRNAFIKHQVALRNQKLAGFSQRRYNSSEELPSQDHLNQFLYQHSQVPNTRGLAAGKELGTKPAGNFEYEDEDDDDMQKSGYGAGFKRTNSLGRADMYQRYFRNQDFYFTDRTHVSQYKDVGYAQNNEVKQPTSIPRLSPALQQRLMNVTLSSPVSYANSPQAVGVPKRNGAGYDQPQQVSDIRVDNAAPGPIFSSSQMYNANPGPKYNEHFSMCNGVPMRDEEDGVVHSRYEQGKSLIVPTQPFGEDYLASSGDGMGSQNRNRASLPSRMSVGSRISEASQPDMISPLKVPNELKTIDATDLATKLFTLDGFSSSDIAPLLGKNTEFSQLVCSEYMKFMNFEGYSIDEATRILLQKFPLTGETQERERILLQFSKRYHECNKQLYGSEDAVHTLTCALMLLNTDLHGQNIGNKMTLNEFINNLSGLYDGEDFSKELLKTLYQSIKNKEILYAFNETPREIKPSPKSRKPSSNGNPFIELKADDDAIVIQNGMLNRKCIMDSDGRRCPPHKRRWKTYYCVLKGLILFLRKHDRDQIDQSIGIHHSLAGPAKDYRKRNFVFKLITADWRVFLFEAKSKADVQSWVDAVNLTAAALSSPPLPAPCSSSKQFTRPVMPVSVTRHHLEEQIKRHQERAESVDKDMQNHREMQPSESSKDFKDWIDKMDYLEFEYKRFSAYGKVLTLQRLKQRLDFLLSSREPRTEEAPSNRPLRSSSMNDIERSNEPSPMTRRKMRESYLRAVHH